MNIVVGAVHRGVVRPASGFVERDSERLNGCSIKDGVRRLIDISLACRDRYCDTFSSDGFGDFENRYSITGCSEISDDIGREGKRRASFGLKPTVVSQTGSYELRHALARSS